MLSKKIRNKIARVMLSDDEQRKNEEELGRIYEKYKEFTMIQRYLYVENLKIAAQFVKDIPGDVVECGVWRGGMMAGVAEVLGKGRKYYLFDSFEGLPEAKEIDGEAATKWQNDKDSLIYYDNCSADTSWADRAMKMSSADFQLVKGWFDETVPSFSLANDIALLRLDGDWYDSTMICLEHLYPKVVENGVLLIDDYFAWDGCSKAVHDYLAKIKSNSKIRTYKELCYIIKTENGRQY